MANTDSQKPRVVLVTGDSSGIGYATCERLAALGRTIYGASRRELKNVAWMHLRMDVADEASVEKTIAYILDREGCLDAVVHSAGNSLAGPFEETSVEEARTHFEVNYFGTVRVLRAVLPAMRLQRRGRLLIVGSIGGLIGLRYQSHYSAGKFALDGLIESMRPEIRPFGIDATVVHPGDFNTFLPLEPPAPPLSQNPRTSQCSIAPPNSTERRRKTRAAQAFLPARSRLCSMPPDCRLGLSSALRLRDSVSWQKIHCRRRYSRSSSGKRTGPNPCSLRGYEVPRLNCPV